MKSVIFLFVTTTCVLLLNCSEKQQQAIGEQKKPKLMQHQIDSLNKAKQLNKKVLKATDRRHKQIDSQDQ